MKLLVLMGLAWSGDALGAEPLFVPAFTPNSPSEAPIARTLERRITKRLRDEGHFVIDAATAATVVDASEIARCAVLPTCPTQVLPRLPARFSVVARVDRLSDGTLLGHVEYYETARPQPLRVTDAAVVAGQETAFVNEVARTTNELIAEVGPSDDAMRNAARQLLADAQQAAQPAPTEAPRPPAADAPTVAAPTTPSPPATPQPEPEPDAEPVVLTGPRGDGETPHTQPIDVLIADTNVKRRYLVGAERHFKKSGLDPRDYMYVATPHAGRVLFEVRAGFGSGDIDRTAQIRAEVARQGDGVTQTNAFYREGPATGQNFRGEFFLGYAPVTLIDFGVLFGLQYGQRTIRTGVYTRLPSGETETPVGPADDVQALNIYLQPRLRLFLVPFGPAKPFVVGGGEFRFIDSYQLAGPEGVTFLVPESTVVPGAVVGGGMMIDPGPIVGLFAEATYTRHFGGRAVASEATSMGPWDYDEPALDATEAATFAINGGVQFRL